MKKLIFILQKEFRQIFRDRTILAMMFGMPIIQLVILPMAANFEIKGVNVVYVDHDHSSYSRKLLQKVAASGYFRIADQSDSYHKAMGMIAKGKADLILEIPAGFERNLVREHQQPVFMVLDAINGTKSSIGGSYLMEVLRDFNANLDINYKNPGPSALMQTATIHVKNTNWYNSRLEYKYYMVPGILVLLLTMIGCFLTALNIVKEKEIGTIEQINVSPIKKWQFILGKLIPFWIVGLIVFTVGLVVMLLIHGISLQGSVFVLYLFAAFYLIAVLGLGLLISTLSNTQLQAMFIAFFFMMVFMLMSGLFTSTDSMPDWARTLSQLTPVTHFVRVIRLVVLKGSGFEHLHLEFLYLVVFAMIFNGLAVFNYRKTN